MRKPSKYQTTTSNLQCSSDHIEPAVSTSMQAPHGVLSGIHAEATGIAEISFALCEVEKQYAEANEVCSRWKAAVAEAKDVNGICDIALFSHAPAHVQHSYYLSLELQARVRRLQFNLESIASQPLSGASAPLPLDSCTAAPLSAMDGNKVILLLLFVCCCCCFVFEASVSLCCRK